MIHLSVPPTLGSTHQKTANHSLEGGVSFQFIHQEHFSFCCLFRSAAASAMFLIPIAIVLSPWSSLFPINYLCLYAYMPTLPYLFISLGWGSDWCCPAPFHMWSRGIGISSRDLWCRLPNSSSHPRGASEYPKAPPTRTCTRVSNPLAYALPIHISPPGAISTRTFFQRLHKPWLKEAAYRAPEMSIGVIGCRAAFRPFATLRFGVVAGRRLLLPRSLASTARRVVG